MKFLLVTLLLMTSLFAHAEMDAAQKDQALTLSVDLPEVFGKDQVGQILVEHDINFSRVKDSEPFEKILRLIYFQGSKEKKSFNPEDIEGTIISKEQLKGYLDTDLLKVKFDLPLYNVSKKADVYPLALKFRASMMQRIFKSAKLLIVRVPEEKAFWKVFYNGVLEIDGISIKINAFGQVVKLDLLFKGKIAKSLAMSEIETIAEKDF
ncbi:MAG: hypothetical protein ACOYL6_06355 [Bacteriovoracaceae bacterium]